MDRFPEGLLYILVFLGIVLFNFVQAMRSRRRQAEAEALLRARNGDASAYGLLVQSHQEAAFRAAYLILRDAQAALRSNPATSSTASPTR